MGEELDFEDWIRQTVKCCACESKLNKSKYINAICLDKKATWKNNTWGNVIVGVSGYAVAIVCDKCAENKVEPRYAVEWDDNESEVRYHLVSELKLMPEFDRRLLKILAGDEQFGG
jgi:hypothetical protein